MAQFCTKCGAALTEEMSFCTGCGAAVGATTVAPPTMTPAAASMDAAPVAGTPAPTAPAGSSGGPLLKIILAVVGLLIFFSLLGLGACVFMVYRTKQRVNEFKRQAEITFPAAQGTREVRVVPPTPPLAPPTTPPATNPEVPIYPGASVAEGGVELPAGLGGVKVQQYITDDPVDKVVSFYKDKLGPQASLQESGGKAVLQLLGANGMTSITVIHDEATRKTKFSITSIGK